MYYINNINMKTVLITGGSGMIGRALSELLLSKGYKVIWVSRERHNKAPIPRYYWDYRKNKIDEEAILETDIIVHLAGKNIMDPWIGNGKKQIVESRVRSALMLLDKFKAYNKKPEAFISASAIGYYGNEITEEIFTEESIQKGNDFLSRLCKRWEESTNKFTEDLGVRTVSVRTGMVLSHKSDALQLMMTPVKLWVGSPIGTGKQYISWIHIDDLCELYLKAIEDITMKGPYNAVAPEYITNSEFMHTIAKVLKKPFIFPKIPSFFVRLFFGETAETVLGGSRISSKKLQEQGFKFKYLTAKEAVEACVNKGKEESKKKMRKSRAS